MSITSYTSHVLQHALVPKLSRNEAWRRGVIRDSLMNSAYQRTDLYQNWRHDRSVLTTAGQAGHAAILLTDRLSELTARPFLTLMQYASTTDVKSPIV